MPATNGERTRGQLILDGAAWGAGFITTSLLVGGLWKLAYRAVTKKQTALDDDGEAIEELESEED